MIYLLRTSCCGSEQLPIYCYTLGLSSDGLLYYEYDDDDLLTTRRTAVDETDEKKN